MGKWCVCYKVFDDSGYLEARDRSSILFPDRQSHVLALYNFLDFLQSTVRVLCKIILAPPHLAGLSVTGFIFRNQFFRDKRGRVPTKGGFLNLNTPDAGSGQYLNLQRVRSFPL